MTNPELQAENQQLRLKIQQLTARIADLEAKPSQREPVRHVQSVPEEHGRKKIDGDKPTR